MYQPNSDQDIADLCERLDTALDNGGPTPEAGDRVALIEPLEKALAGRSDEPFISNGSPSGRIARILWFKTHPERSAPDVLLDGIQDPNSVVRATAAETLGAVLRSSGRPWLSRTLSSRLRAVLEQQRKAEQSPFIAFLLEQLIDQVGRFSRSRQVSSPPEILNPYVAGPPVRDKSKFFGREDVFRQIAQVLKENGGAKSVVIYGGRRTGKTSLLYRIREGELGETFVPVYLDMQALDGEQASKFLRALVNVVEGAGRMGGQSALPPSPRRQEFADFSLLHSAVETTLEQIAPRRLLIMFDEYEVLKNFLGDASMARQLQALLEKSPSLFFLFAGAQKVEALNENNFFFLLDNAKYLKISFLSLEDASRLITEPARGILTFEDSVVGRIQELCAGHPFYIQMICQSLFEMSRGEKRVDLAKVKDACRQFIENPTPHLILGWNSMPLDQKITASALAAVQSERNRWVSPSELLAYFGTVKYSIHVGYPELRQALATLRELDWIEKNEDRYRVKMELIRLWIVEHQTIWNLLDMHRRTLLDRAAGLGRRGFAFVVDLCVLGVLALVMEASRLRSSYYPPALLSYFLLAMVMLRATPGMFIAKIRPLNEAGVRLQPLQALRLGVLLSLPLFLFTCSLVYFIEEEKFRDVGLLLAVGSLCLELLHAAMIYFNKKGRGFFDKLAHVVIVRQ